MLTDLLLFGVPIIALASLAVEFIREWRKGAPKS
jgi:hypothetical protein